jgi:hypothetical protein
MPAGLQDRYVALYKKFADSWRVTPATSLFVYASGTSTATFTDKDWPAAKPPCKLKPELQVPGVKPFAGMPIEKARVICNAITLPDLHDNCVFDVATTGDPIFAEGYRVAQDLRLYGTAVKLTAAEAPARQDRRPDEAGDQAPKRSALRLTATVSAQMPDRPTPTGDVTFLIDDRPMQRPVKLDARGRAHLMLAPLKPGEHTIRAVYGGGGKYDYHSSSSPNLRLAAERGGDPKEPQTPKRPAPKPKGGRG